MVLWTEVEGKELSAEGSGNQGKIGEAWRGNGGLGGFVEEEYGGRFSAIFAVRADEFFRRKALCFFRLCNRSRLFFQFHVVRSTRAGGVS